MNKSKHLLTVSFCSFLTACTVGPDFVPPITEAPARYAVTLPNQKQVDYSEWWQAFLDPMLNKLITTGLEQNYSLAEARAKIITEEASVDVTKAEGKPTIPAHFNATHDTQSLVALQKHNPFLIESTMLYDIGIEPSWIVDLFGGQRRALEAAEAELGSTIVDAAANQVALAADIANEYIHFRQLQATIAEQQHLIAVDSDLIHLENIRYQAGLANAVSLQSDIAALNQAKADLNKQRYELATSLYSIDALIGVLPDNNINNSIQRPAPIPTVQYVPQTGLPSQLLQQRPDILVAEAKLEQANANIGVAMSEYFPKFTLGKTYGQQSVNINELFKYDANYSSLGPFIDWRILDFWRIKYDVNKNKGLTREALLHYQEVVINAFKEVDSALVTFAKQKSRVVDQRQALNKQLTRVTLEKQRYQSGLESYLEVLRQQQDAINKEQLVLEDQRDYSQDFVELSEALGGGWHAEPQDDKKLPEPLG